MTADSYLLKSNKCILLLKIFSEPHLMNLRQGDPDKLRLDEPVGQSERRQYKKDGQHDDQI